MHVLTCRSGKVYLVRKTKSGLKRKNGSCSISFISLFLKLAGQFCPWPISQLCQYSCGLPWQQMAFQHRSTRLNDSSQRSLTISDATTLILLGENLAEHLFPICGLLWSLCRNLFCFIHPGISLHYDLINCTSWVKKLLPSDKTPINS